MEEDLFVVIVGDPPVSQIPLSAFKFEPDEDRLITDVPVESILERATGYSEIIDYDDIKKEVSDPDYLSLEEGSDYDEYDPENDSVPENDSIPENNLTKTVKKRRRKKNKKPAPPRERALVDDMRATDVKSVCPVCKLEFPNVTEMQIHTSIVHEELLFPHKCTHCPAAYPHIIALKRHIKVKHSGIQYICDICKHVFNKKDSLITHIEVHSGVKNFACELCPKKYRKKFNLKVHMDKIHYKIPPPFICETCPYKRYYLMSELKAHMKKEHGVTLMTNTNLMNRLPTMGKRLLNNAKIVTKEEMEQLRIKTKDQEYDKQRRHNASNRFVCAECSKGFAKIFDLNSHVKREHRKIKPLFACEICDKRYYTMSPLKQHMQREHGVTLIDKSKLMDKLPTMNEKIVRAKILSKEEFKKLGDNKEKLNQDLEYISIMQFPCPDCPNTYELKKDLKEHIETTHSRPEQPVTCQICKKEYNQLISLKRHMKRQHKMIIMTPQKFQNIMPKLSKTQIEEAQIILKPASTNENVNESVDVSKEGMTEETMDGELEDTIEEEVEETIEETVDEEVVDNDEVVE